METNDFGNIKTFAELQQARRTVERRIGEKRGKLWISFVISFIRGLRERLEDGE